MERPDDWWEYEWNGWLFRCRDGALEMARVGSRSFQPYDAGALGRPVDEELERALANLEAYPR